MPHLPTPTPLLLAVTVALVAGCSGDGASPFDPVPPDTGALAATAPGDLELTLPPVTQALFTTATVRVHDAGPPESAPARIITGEDDLETDRPLQQIFNARTRTGFQDGFAYALGINEYIGNNGRISTTAEAMHGDRPLGSYTAQNQDYTPFFYDLGALKTIWTWAKIFTDETCGVTIGGHSKHEAWWQMFQGRSAPMWGVAAQTSQGQPSRQPGCRTTGGYEQENSEPGGIICYYWVTFDLTTGEVLDYELLWCASTGGGALL